MDGIEDWRPREVAACTCSGSLAASAVATKRSEHYKGGEAEDKAKRTASMAHGAHTSEKIRNGAWIFEALGRAVGNTRGECTLNPSRVSDLFF